MKISDSNINMFSSSSFNEQNITKTKIKQINNSPPPNENPSSINRDQAIRKDQISLSFNAKNNLLKNNNVDAVSIEPVSTSTYKTQMQLIIEALTGKKIKIDNIKDNSNTQSTNSNNFNIEAETIVINQTNISYEHETMNFESSGNITTSEGEEINFNLNISMDRNFFSKEEIEFIQEPKLIDPIVINLHGEPIGLSNSKFEFDLNSDGQTENISYLKKGSGFLSLDINNDGIINNGKELFGPNTNNGYYELSLYDDDKNNWIDENDAIFNKLSVWIKNDENQDKLLNLKDAGIGAISILNANTQFNIKNDNNELLGKIVRSSIYIKEDGQVFNTHQIDLALNDEKI